jgi:hypothetical protein
MSHRVPYQTAIQRIDIMRVLAAFDPHVVGTLPLGIHRPDSDIDIVCHATDPHAVVEVIWEHFCRMGGFTLYQWSASGRPVIARFEAAGWPFEIFAGADPVQEQPGCRHFTVERRLLDLGGPAFRTAITALRVDGVKTEPAFAIALGLSGNPYRLVSELFHNSDHQFIDLLAKRGFFGDQHVRSPDARHHE